MSVGKFAESYQTIDKSRWPRGPWDAEPDKAVWVDEATGLDCMIVRGPLGALCGYVGVPPEHPLHGTDYNDAPNFDVHWGLTYARECSPRDDPSRGICHIPQQGRPDNVWWFGFDCGHCDDLIPGCGSVLYDAMASFGAYRNLGYVLREVENLARQLVDRGDEAGPQAPEESSA